MTDLARARPGLHEPWRRDAPVSPPAHGHSLRPRFLLARPDHFDVTYSINPFMDASAVVDCERALAQWNGLRRRLLELGAIVSVQAGRPGCPDLVFTNNAALVLGRRALLARFRHRERDGEVPANRRALELLALDVTELPAAAGAFEGAADATPFNGHLLCAHGPRTERTTHPFLAAFSGLPVVPLELTDPRLYHLDMVFCGLGDGAHALVVPDALGGDSYRRLRQMVERPLELSLDEALSFCANAVVVGRSVLMHHVPDRVRDLLAAARYRAVEVPVDEFLKSGGSVACMALRLNRPLLGQGQGSVPNRTPSAAARG